MKNTLMLLFLKMKQYGQLIKSLQTGLLLATGIAGYFSTHTVFSWATLTAVTGSLFLAISGSTILNMWYDRDIDSVMNRTHNRPLVTSELSKNEALILGLVSSILGLVWSFSIFPLFGLIVFAGLFFDVFIYTIWLKRRTCWSVIWGGISGSMPILAGRVASLGHIDMVGILLAFAVLFWIPTHIMTFSMRYHSEYLTAGVPTFPSTYGFEMTRASIALSSIIAAACIGVAGLMIGINTGYLRLILVLSIGLLLLSLTTVFRPSERVNFGLFKYASLYMLATMVLLAV